MRSIASIMRSMWSAARRAAGTPARQSRRSTRKASRALKKGPSDPPGYGADKKIKGEKRHILVDAQGLLTYAIARAGDVQDRDGGVLVMATLYGDAVRALPVPAQAFRRWRLPLCRFRRRRPSITG